MGKPREVDAVGGEVPLRIVTYFSNHSGRALLGLLEQLLARRSAHSKASPPTHAEASPAPE